jgi:hypothetical protein
MPKYRRVAAISLSTTLLLLATLAAPARAGGGQFAFSVRLNEPCFELTGPAETEVTVSLRTAGGNLRDRVRTNTGPEGFVCFRLSIHGGSKA